MKSLLTIYIILLVLMLPLQQNVFATTPGLPALTVLAYLPADDLALSIRLADGSVFENSKEKKHGRLITGFMGSGTSCSLKARCLLLSQAEYRLNVAFPNC
ncbi:MAG: hypothetical protein LBS21_09690 [Clostridiales bacterium]|nr:hypothetical protein [Clostridiales bacterium]